MASIPPLEVKVVYSAAKHRGGDRRARPVGTATLNSRLVILGLLNLIAGGGLYYATWWQADPELRFKVFMHTPLPGVDLQAAADVLGPPGPHAVSTRREAADTASEIRAQTARAAWFVGTAAGWEILATIAACSLALAGGALLASGGGVRIRLIGAMVGLVGLAVLAWRAYVLWERYERFVPDQIRVDMGGIVLITAMVGLIVARGARRLTYVAAILLILSAGGSALALDIGARYNAVNPEKLPVPFVVFLALVFAVHSLWGWILLVLAPRIAGASHSGRRI